MKKATPMALVAAVLAVIALPTAATAVETMNPHKFTGTSGTAPKFSAEGAQTFALKPFTVTCEKAKGTGEAETLPSKTLGAVVKFSGCEAEALIGKAEYELKAKFLTPVTINYHANGFVELGAGGTIKEGKLEGAGTVEIAVKGAFKCTIDIEPGTYPINATKKPEGEFEAAKYTNKEEPVGKKMTLVKSLGIANSIGKMPYEIEGEFCEALPKTEFTNGTYTGSLVGQIKKGALGWE